MREAGDRIRRERALSPRLVLRRILVLSEGRQYREAAAVLAKLGTAGLAAVAGELPIDLLVEGLPHSAQLLEILFSKLVQGGLKANVNGEPVLWQLVKLFAAHEDPTLKTKVGRLAKALLAFQPDFHMLLATRRKTLEQAIQGLGCHGLTPDITGLTHLHVALKVELQRHIDAYKAALHTLDELGLLAASNNKRPVDASHQRLLALHHGDVQQRLIDNKTLLTVLDKPCLQQLRPLVDTLAARVQNDKEALFCVTQLKRFQRVPEEKPVASILMAFSRGCGALLELMQVTTLSMSSSLSATESPCHSDGYHSETETDVERGKDLVGRYASLYYQNRPRALEALDSLQDLYHATQLKAKILFSIVVLSFRTCRSLRDAKLRDMFRALQLPLPPASVPPTSPLHVLRRDAVRCLAVAAAADEDRTEPGQADPSTVYPPLADVERQVRRLVCDTLKEYRCLETCGSLNRFISDVSRVAWHLVNQDPAYELDTDFQTPARFSPARHQRHHAADRHADTVRSYLWPALLVRSSSSGGGTAAIGGNSNNGTGFCCVHKAVVITG